MISEVEKDTKDRMTKSIESLTQELGKIRTGRASTGLFENIKVDYYGVPTPLNQVASIIVSDARNVTITPWELKMGNEIERAIANSDLGLNPVNTGDMLRVPMPSLTEERRKDITKRVRSEGENAKVAIRNIRRDANTKLKDSLKDKAISEDEEHKAQEHIQKITDTYISDIEQAISEKEKEVMQV